MAIKSEWLAAQDEDLNSWLFRMYTVKQNESKLSFKRISELAKEFFDINLEPSTISSYFRDYKTVTPIDSESFENDESSVDELTKDLLINAHQKNVNNLNRQAINRTLKTVSNNFLTKELIVNAIANLEPLSYEIKPINNGSNEAVLLLSDWHRGQVSDNFFNKFNDEIFNERVERLINKTKEYCQLNNVSKLHILTLGDMINGGIHVQTRIESQENLVQQTINVSESLAHVFNMLSSDMNLELYFCRGNHDRVTPNKDDAINAESFSDIIPWFLQERLKNNERIHFNQNEYDDEIILAKVCNQTVIGVHGHKDSYTKAINNLSLFLKQIPDYICMGHFHHSREVDEKGIELIINPSLCGTDTFAKDCRRFSKAGQKLLMFNEDEGRYATYFISFN